MKALTLIFTFSIMAAFSQATSTLVTMSQPQQINETKLIGGCYYNVTVKTSCKSPAHTKDKIGVIFGDAYGAKVSVPRLDDPNSRTGIFKKCSTATFIIEGPCMERTCKLYLYRAGRDGWVADTVIVDDHVYPPIKFFYNSIIPDDYGWGFDHCKRS